MPFGHEDDCYCDGCETLMRQIELENKRPEIQIGDWVNFSSDRTPLLAVVTGSENTESGCFGIGQYDNRISVDEVVEIRQEDGTVWSK